MKIFSWLLIGLSYYIAFTTDNLIMGIVAFVLSIFNLLSYKKPERQSFSVILKIASENEFPYQFIIGIADNLVSAENIMRKEIEARKLKVESDNKYSLENDVYDIEVRNMNEAKIRNTLSYNSLGGFSHALNK